MDEVFGFVPPTAAPPAKKPILTILKQARAFGVGMVLATQNPVDLDYKAMSNAGTWLVGRLQTERDKERVLEGLRSAAGGTDIAKLDEAIGALKQRQFLLVSAHEPEPVVFRTRWAMSYLRGPLTKEQIATLMQGAASAGRPRSVGRAAGRGRRERVAPTIAAGVPVRHAHPAAPWLAAGRRRPGRPRLRAYLAARASIRFDDAAAELDDDRGVGGAVRTARQRARPRQRERRSTTTSATSVPTQPAGASYVVPQRPLGEASFFRDAERADPAAAASTARTLEIFRNRPLKLFSRPGETEEQFAARADEAAQAAADAETARIRDRLEAKQDRLEA